jgi:prophage DNA circulation protein
MGQISNIENPWRKILLSAPASFRGVIFHVEQGTRTSGRRTVTHLYPKANLPYSEDMGLHARRWAFSGYLIYRPSNPVYNYTIQRNRLIAALEQDDAGRLIHPVFVPIPGIMVMCERYSMMESRERGGYTQFEMAFVEQGIAGNVPRTNTSVVLKNAYAAAATTIVDTVNSSTKSDRL